MPETFTAVKRSPASWSIIWPAALSWPLSVQAAAVSPALSRLDSSPPCVRVCCRIPTNGMWQKWFPVRTLWKSWNWPYGLIAVNPPPSLVEPMQRDSRGMLRTIRRILPDEDDAQLLLVIDQFEELFTMVMMTSRRNHFLESLLVAITAPRTPVRVVITLRADFYDRPLQYQPLAELFKRHTELVLPLTHDELTWAILEPARRMGVGFGDGLDSHHCQRCRWPAGCLTLDAVCVDRAV